MEKKFVWERRKKILLVLTVLSVSIYITWRVFFTLPLKHGAAALVSGILLLTAELLSAYESLYNYYTISRNKLVEIPVISPEQYPDVDVFIATHNEDAQLLYKTVNACMYMDYPDKSKVHIYLCDDNNRLEIAELARHFGIGYFGLEGNKHAKAGNLNNALAQTDSPLVVTFDADMIPRREFLMRTVPYFELHKMKKRKNDEKWVMRREEAHYSPHKMGFVQAPQCFYNADLFQYNLYAKEQVTNEQDYFFQVVNPSRNMYNASMYVGSNTVLRREALEEAGGFATDSITEDFSTGLRIQKCGYRSIAIDELLAYGLSPMEFSALIKQRKRWARGGVQTLRAEKPFRNRNLSIGQKLCYFGCYLYWTTYIRQIIFITVPIATALLGITPLDASIWHTLLIWGPSYLLSNLALKKMSGGVNNVHVSNLSVTVLFPFIAQAFIAEHLGFKEKKFNVTEKRITSGKRQSLHYGIMHIVLLILSAISLFKCIWYSFATGVLYLPIVMIWLTIITKNLLFSVLIFHGRPLRADMERLKVSEAMHLDWDGWRIKGKTMKLADNSLLFSLKADERLPQDKRIACRIYTDRYNSEFQIKIMDARKRQGKMLYHAHIAKMTDADRREYFQIIHDRALFAQIKEGDIFRILDDLFFNIKKHSKQIFAERRPQEGNRPTKTRRDARPKGSGTTTKRSFYASSAANNPEGRKVHTSAFKEKVGET